MQISSQLAASSLDTKERLQQINHTWILDMHPSFTFEPLLKDEEYVLDYELWDFLYPLGEEETEFELPESVRGL